jgi:hypothetical protein
MGAEEEKLYATFHDTVLIPYTEYKTLRKGAESREARRFERSARGSGGRISF